MSLVPREPEGTSGRTTRVSRTFLRTGQGASRSLWVKISPRHPLLKIVMVPLMVAVMLIMLIMVLLILGFAFLAMMLAWIAWRLRRGETESA